MKNKYTLSLLKPKAFNVTTLMLFLFIILVIPIFLIATYDQPSADDYVYGLMTKQTWQTTGSLIQTFSTAWHQMVHSYMTWDGNFFGTFLGALQPSVFGLYTIVPLFIVLSLIVSTLFLAKVVLENYLGATRQVTAIIGLIVLILSLEFMPSAVQGIYWYDGAISYTFIYALSLTLLGTLLLYYRSKRSATKIAFLTISALLGFLISGGNFVSSLMILMILAFLCVAQGFKKTKLFWGSAFVFLTTLAGLLISALAPGNGMRQYDTLKTLVAQPSPFSAIIQSLYYAVVYLFKWTSIPVVIGLLMIGFLLYRLADKSTLKFEHPLIVLWLSFSVYAAGFTPPIYALGSGSLIWETRIMNLLFFSALLLWCVNLFYFAGYAQRHIAPSLKDQFFSSDLLFKRPAFSLALMIGFAFVFAPFTGVPVTSLSASTALIDGSAAQYAEESQNRLAIYENKSIEHAHVPEYSVKPYLLYYDDIKADTNDWRNKSVANYYKKASVSLKK
ncbi:MAG: DUF6056 family protein [Eubacterium sp.]